MKLYKIFIEKDATMVEINPLAEIQSGEVMCMDAKFGFDDNAEFRQAGMFIFLIQRFSHWGIKRKKIHVRLLLLNGIVNFLF